MKNTTPAYARWNTDEEFCINVSGELFFKVSAVASLDLSIFDINLGAILGMSLLYEDETYHTYNRRNCNQSDFPVYISRGIDASFYTITKSFNFIDLGKTQVL